MIELSTSELPIAWPLLRDFPHKQDFIHSVYECRQRGRVFVDSKEKPKAAILVHSGGNVILAGSAQSPSVTGFLKELSPTSMTGHPWMQLVGGSEAWERVIISTLGKRVVEVPRLSFFFNRARLGSISGWRDMLAQGQAVRRIDRPVLERINVEYHPYIVEDWGSAESFLEHGVGFQLTLDGRIASVCYGVTRGNGIVPIQIDTREEYRRKGLAFITCAAFIEHCLEHGLRSRWECDVSNIASASLARRLGFAAHSELTVFRMTETG